jgi:hypothetical protein
MKEKKSACASCACTGHAPAQVREQAAWFWSAPRGGPSAADIRADMGDFKHIRCIAKYTARMGQCFSSTADITRLQARGPSALTAPQKRAWGLLKQSKRALASCHTSRHLSPLVTLPNFIRVTCCAS